MVVTQAQTARRALVKVLLSLAAVYAVLLSVTRESNDADVLAGYRKVVRKVHPDKGGQTADAQRLQAAKDAWDAAKKDAKQSGRPRSDDRARSNHEPAQAMDVADPEKALKAYRIQSKAVMLTYNGVVDLAQWHRFVGHVRANVCKWGVKHWCCTLEVNSKGKLHIHMMVQFHKLKDRDSRCFFFEGLKPRVDSNDLLGEGWSGRKLQDSFDRGFFYCYADKIGTQRDASGAVCLAGNYAPVWDSSAPFHYCVRARWAQGLWKAMKLTHAVYEDYLYKTRDDGIIGKKRTLDACVQREEQEATAKEMAAVVSRIRSNSELFRPFPQVPQAQAWLECFSKDALRYPIMIVLGESQTGKTEWVKSLFKQPLELKIGCLEHFPEEMRAFKRGVHDAVILDDVRDLAFLVRHQEKIQGKYDKAVEFASTPGGQCSYTKWLFCVPFAATCNYSTENLSMLKDNDFLGKDANRVFVEFAPAAV